MTHEQLGRVKSLCEQVLDRPPAERDAFLEASGETPSVVADVRKLIAGDSQTGSFPQGAGSAASATGYVPLGAGTKLGCYEVLEPLGSGGMGEVYLAHDPRLDRRVAIKLLPAQLAADLVARERLRREARAAAALDHPFICKIFELGEDQDALFLVMEYVRGTTLSARMRAGRLSQSEALRIAQEVAEGLEEAHGNRIVHRDLKPANVMLTSQGRAKVMDFGLAKRLEADAPQEQGTDALATDDQQLTAEGIAVGTPDYMSPEQLRGAPLDQRSDLFSFGILLCELLTGTHPFRRASRLDTIAAILRDPPLLSFTGSTRLTPGLALMIHRLLAKRLEERYASMAEVRADLTRLATLSLAETGPSEEDAAPRIPLIGRDPQRADLIQLLNGAIAGQGALVLIGGEPGIGKTHLTRAILKEAARRGCFTVTGHCYEMAGAPPYVPFIEMLEYSARVVPQDSFRYALGEAAPEVAKLMPELRRMFPDISPPLELPPEQQRRFLFNAYREFVERSARVTPIVAVFEDLHWADEPSLLLLEHLAQTAGTAALLLIGTYRDAGLDVTHPFARTLESLLRQKLATRTSLRRLAAGGVEAMLTALSGQTPPSSVVRIVFEETDGNPFFVEEVFRHLAEEGKLFDEKGAWRPGLRAAELRVPESVRLVIGRRLERLGEEARRVLATAALIGRTFSLRLLEELENGRPDAALETLEDAERSHLVMTQHAGRETCYRFVHELIRQTLAETLSLPRRQRLHARVAGAIERLYAGNLDGQTSALAHHLYQAGAAADPEKAADWLIRAVRQASAATAYEEALAYSDNALALLQGEQSPRVAELYTERATILRSLGRTPEAIAAYELALAVFAANSEVVRFAETSVGLVLILLWRLQLQQAREVARRALGLLGAEESPLRMALLSGKAIAASCSGEPDTALALLDEVQQSQPKSQHPFMIGMTLNLQANVRWHAAQIERAEKASSEAQQVLENCGDVWGQVDVTWIRVLATIFSGRLSEAESIVRQTVPIAERVGHVGFLWCAKFAEIARHVAGGDLDNADRVLREAVEYGRLFQIGWNFIAETELGSIARLRGHTAEAAAWCRRAMAPQKPQNSYSAYAPAALGLTLAQEGDPGAWDALREALRFLPHAGRLSGVGSWLSVAYVIEGLATIGRAEEAGQLRPVAEDLGVTGIAMTYTSALPRTAAGIAAACERDWGGAEEHHQAAIHQADTIPHRVAQPIARYWYAVMLLARGRQSDATSARALLGEALRMFESLGMPLYARQAGDRLAGL